MPAPGPDKPLEELLVYEGTNPRPADHDAYWARALREMRAVEPRVELVPAEFQAPFCQCFHYYFTGVKGARIHAKLLRPKMQSGPGPAAVHFHGYTMRSADWTQNMYLGLVAAGFTVAALDCRGQAGLSEDTGGVKGTTFKGNIIRGLNDENPDNLMFRQIFLDCAQLAGLVIDMDNVDSERVVCFGESQGGALTMACAALEPRIKRAASGYPFLSDYKRVWEMDLAKESYEELKTFFRQFDPTHERAEHWFTKLGYVDIQFLAPRIEAEVLMGVGMMDEICPPSTQYACYNKIKSRKSTMIFPDFAHEHLPGYGDRVYSFLVGV